MTSVQLRFFIGPSKSSCLGPTRLPRPRCQGKRNWKQRGFRSGISFDCQASTDIFWRAGATFILANFAKSQLPHQCSRGTLPATAGIFLDQILGLNLLVLRFCRKWPSRLFVSINDMSEWPYARWTPSQMETLLSMMEPVSTKKA